MEEKPQNTRAAEDAVPDLEPGGGDSYVNAEDLFFWMEDLEGAEIPLAALWIDIPTGCRFCC